MLHLALGIMLHYVAFDTVGIMLHLAQFGKKVMYPRLMEVIYRGFNMI